MSEFLAKCSGCSDILELTGRLDNSKIILNPDARLTVKNEQLHDKCGGTITLIGGPGINAGSYSFTIQAREDLPVKKGRPFKKKLSGKRRINEPVS